MKRTVQFKTLITFLLVPLFVTALNNSKEKGKYSKEKKINKEYSVSPNANLSIKNSYGNLDIVTWNESRIVFEITITTSGNNEEKVKERLNDITIDFEGNSNNVSATTKFGKGKSNSWWGKDKKNNVNVKVHYIVKMPITNSVDLNNDYGSINLGKLEGQAKINCDYGKITTKELMADNNILVFDYSNGCYFDYIKSGKINADYSGYTVGKTKSLYVNADYTQSKIEIAETINYNCDYGSLTINSANTINGNSDYLSLKIGEIYNTAILKADYGSIKIEKLQTALKSLIVKSGYTGIKIGFDPSLNFDFNIDLNYANLNGGDNFNFTEKIKEPSQKRYSGYYGNKNSGTSISINSQYGGVNFYKN